MGDNPGPLAELWNLDKGCWVATECGIPDTDNAEIQSSSLARDSSKQKFTNPRRDLKGGGVPRISSQFESIVFKRVIFSYFFS